MQAHNLDRITELRHALHKRAELSMQETETMKFLKDFIQKNTSLPVTDCGKWFYAVKEGKKRDLKIAFRADMDALPMTEDDSLPYHSRNQNAAHKCGHDGHCAVLCGLALELDQMTECIPSVYLIFQPGEETGEGAMLCRELIRQENISGIYAFHNLGGFPEGSIVYRRGLTQPSSEGLKLCFHGKTSHASAPEEGRNPADILAEIVMLTRERAGSAGTASEGFSGRTTENASGKAPESTSEKASEKTSGRSSVSWKGMVLCTVTGMRLGSGDFGISPGEGELCLTLRAEYEEEMKSLEKAILDYAGKICAAAQIDWDASIHDYFPETRNDDRCLDKVLRAASEEGAQVIPMEHLWRASEDFGWYLKECPGAMVYIGNGERYPALHTEKYDFNDRILGCAVDLFVRVVGQESKGKI